MDKPARRTPVGKAIGYVGAADAALRTAVFWLERDAADEELGLIAQRLAEMRGSLSMLSAIMQEKDLAARP